MIDVRSGIAWLALIARYNRAGRLEWCLPKGHVEPGETLALVGTAGVMPDSLRVVPIPFPAAPDRRTRRRR